MQISCKTLLPFNSAIYFFYFKLVKVCFNESFNQRLVFTNQEFSSDIKKETILNHVELIISAFQVKDLKRNYFPNFQAGRYAIENLLKDKNAKISKKEVKDIVNIARNDWYFTHQIIDNLTKILSGNKKINEEVATALVKEAISTDKNLLSQVRYPLCD